jgi:hypothetical protein
MQILPGCGILAALESPDLVEAAISQSLAGDLPPEPAG